MRRRPLVTKQFAFLFVGGKSRVVRRRLNCQHDRHILANGILEVSVVRCTGGSRFLYVGDTESNFVFGSYKILYNLEQKLNNLLYVMHTLYLYFQ